MSEPTVIIRFDDIGRVYRPGETLSGQYLLEAVVPSAVKAIEVSVLWYTEGKGDEDMSVHEFWRHGAEDDDWIAPTRPGRFETTLPHSPLTYDGLILKIHWCVRVRVFMRRGQQGKEVFGEKLFRLGDVPSARTTAS